MTSDLRSHWPALCVLCLALLGAGPGSEESPIADAAMDGDGEAVRSLIKQGADVNAPQGDGMTAIHWGAERGDAEIVSTLIYAGANLKAVTRNGGYAPLHLAAKAGKKATAQLLLEAGADPNIQTSTGVTPLHHAAASGNVETVQTLLDHGADLDAQEYAHGQTPLIFAAAENRPEAITALLAAGASASLATTVVDVVARQEEDLVLRERRNQRMEAIWGTEKPMGGSGAGSGNIPLGFGGLVGHTGGMTPLDHAAREGHMESVVALLAGGADIDQQSADGSSPLLVATINGHWDLAMRLLEQGANPSLASDAGATPLYGTINLQWAPESWYPQPTAQRQQETSHLEVMEVLLRAGADPNVRLEKELWYSTFKGSANGTGMDVSTWGATPFWRAAYGADVQAMKLLVNYGADPTIGTMQKAKRGYAAPPVRVPDPSTNPPVPVGGPAEAPIHAATGAGFGLGHDSNIHRHVPDGWMAAVKYLVEELGADVNAGDAEGFTPLHNAASRGDTELVRYLVEMGADVHAVSRMGHNVADMANGPYWGLPPYPETLEYVESLGVTHNNHCQSC